MCLEWPDAFLSQKIETLIIAVCLRWFRRFVVKSKTVAILHSNSLYHKRALFIPYSEINCGIIMNLLSHILAFVCVLYILTLDNGHKTGYSLLFDVFFFTKKQNWSMFIHNRWILKIKCFVTSVASACFVEFYKILLVIYDMEIMSIYIIFYYY